MAIVCERLCKRTPKKPCATSDDNFHGYTRSVSPKMLNVPTKVRQLDEVSMRIFSQTP